jgi:hypothetical protein
MSDPKITKEQAAKLWPTIERDNEGKIKDFKVSDPQTLYVKLLMNQTNEIVKYEAIQLPSLDAIWSLFYMTDPADGYVYSSKWELHSYVIKDLLSKGETTLIRTPFRYEYRIRKTKHADALQHL